MNETELSSIESQEPLVKRAFAHGLHFAFRHPAPRRPKATLHIRPSSRLYRSPRAQQESDALHRAWDALNERADELVMYLMDYELLVDADPGYQVHMYPTLLRSQRGQLALPPASRYVLLDVLLVDGFRPKATNEDTREP